MLLVKIFFNWKKNAIKLNLLISLLGLIILTSACNSDNGKINDTSQPLVKENSLKSHLLLTNSGKGGIKT